MLVLAHRGGPLRGGERAFRENSLEAIEAAAATGVDGVEIDVRLSADGVPVLLHDARVDRTVPESRGLVMKHQAAELDRLGVPRLAAALEVAAEHDMFVAVELKTLPGDPDRARARHLVESATAAIHDSGLSPERVLVMCFWPPAVDRARTAAPEVPTCVLAHRPVSAAGSLHAAIRRHPWIGPRWPVAPATAAAARRLRRRVFSWTLPDSVAIARARALAVDAVVIDDLDLTF